MDFFFKQQKRWFSLLLIAVMVITMLQQNSIVSKAWGTIDASDEGQDQGLSLIVPQITVNESYDTHLSLTLSVPKNRRILRG